MRPASSKKQYSGHRREKQASAREQRRLPAEAGYGSPAKNAVRLRGGYAGHYARIKGSSSWEQPQPASQDAQPVVGLLLDSAAPPALTGLAWS